MHVGAGDFLLKVNATRLEWVNLDYRYVPLCQQGVAAGDSLSVLCV